MIARRGERLRQRDGGFHGHQTLLLLLLLTRDTRDGKPDLRKMLQSLFNVLFFS